MPLTLRLPGLCALMLVATPLFTATSALAADFDRPFLDRPSPDRPYPGPDRDRPAFGPDDGADAAPAFRPRFRGPPGFAGPGFTGGPDREPESCRTFVRRRFDADGEPVLRRVRVCDEPAFERGPPPPPEEVPPRRWGGPRW